MAQLRSIISLRKLLLFAAVRCLVELDFPTARTRCTYKSNGSLLCLLRRNACCRRLALRRFPRLVPNRVRRLLREVVEFDESPRRVVVEGAKVSVESGHRRIEETVRGRRGRDPDPALVERHLRCAGHAFVLALQVRANVLHRRLEVLRPVAEISPLLVDASLEL